VSKRQSEETIRLAHSLGLRDFGENYLQEAVEKIQNLKDLEIQWHFIGQLQRKKLKDIVGVFDWIHSVDRLEVAEKISELATSKGIHQKVLVQVNIAEETSKGGVPPDLFANFLKDVIARPGLDVRGVMVFPPPLSEGEMTKDWYAMGHELLQFGQTQAGKTFDTLSMGTSSDYLKAAKAGATMLRLGEVLLGSRPS